MPKTKNIVVTPTYDEAENLPLMAEAIISLPVPDLHLLVVDDNSPDGTGRIADELCQKYAGRMFVIHRAGKMGLGTAYVAGFKWAIEHGYDRIVQMATDFSHDPKDVPRLLEMLDQYDGAIGSRYTRGGRLDERWSAWRRLLSWFANRVWVDFILRIGLKDNTSGFRGWRRETLIGLNLDRVKSNGYVFQVEITFLAHKLGYRLSETPIYFADRKYGISKMGFKVQREAALGVLKLRRRYAGVTPKDRVAGG